MIHRDLTSYNLLLDFGKPWQVREGLEIAGLWVPGRLLLLV
jgi:hypothetical protein